jgi:hypothetical protein
VPKVEGRPLQAGVAAPPAGDGGECSWLYAGRSGVSARYSLVGHTQMKESGV